MSSYIDQTKHGAYSEDHNWGDFTYARLWWLYGPERAFAILKGRDPATNADLAAWRRLGRRAAA